MTPLAAELIARKRDGGALSAADIGVFVRGLAAAGTDGSWADAQVGALAMAIVLRGMDRAETVALTTAMTQSGAVLDWPAAGFDGPVLDKHSTGGVGDKVSLLLAPIVAACGAGGDGRTGAIVPMISGRGLGHTGGTLDKLEALPGYAVVPSRERLLRTLRQCGCAIVGASSALAPADQRLYAIRDVTATVESVPLITASILSKKLAAGLQALVLDVKCGSGAFTPTPAAARELATSLVQVARGAGLPALAVVTDMNQVLGSSAGNALEIRETLDYLQGAGPPARDPRLHAVTLALAARLLVLGGVAPDVDTATRQAEAALASGAAAERFARMVALLGGPRDVFADAGLARAPVVRDVPAPRAGMLAAIDVRAVGLTIVALGGGRRRPGDAVGPRVGFDAVLPLGTCVAAGQAVARVHADNEAAAQAAAQAYLAALTFGDAERSAERSAGADGDGRPVLIDTIA